jgi:hypothetical protein
MRSHILFIVVAGLACASAPAAGAQEPAAPRDSLERRVAGLEAQIDSLRHLVAQLAAERRDTTAAADELAAMRARARALAPEAPDTAPPEFILRSRSLSQLNPEIRVTSDVRVADIRPGPQQDNVDVREFCIGFQAALDPYSNAKVFASFGHHVEIEEGYAYWTNLPGGLRLDLGRFRQQFGELNRWHLHAVPGTEYPLFLQEYFGHHGLVVSGASAYTLLPVSSPGGGVHELWGQVGLADNETLFSGGRRLSALGHVNNFWQLSRSTFVQLGATALYGENPDSGLAARVLGLDARVTWRPMERAMYRSFTLRAEGVAVRRRVAGLGETRYGGYAAAELQLSRQAQVGGRIEAVERLDGSTSVWQTSAYLTWWQSEWVFARAEWQHLSAPSAGGARDRTDRLVLQVVWSAGPHKHETY